MNIHDPIKAYKYHLFQLKFANYKLIATFATHGGLAHLARALAWQARGDRFESGILHLKASGQPEAFLF